MAYSRLKSCATKTQRRQVIDLAALFLKRDFNI
jgi:hypothetical protein